MAMKQRGLGIDGAPLVVAYALIDARSATAD
jgi:hypothetical protein